MTPPRPATSWAVRRFCFARMQRARAAASTGADVLIEAESGTGKELLARFIHDSSDRAASLLWP